MGTHVIATGIAQGTARRFYRPELDALRFFAFLAVLLHHGPAPGAFLTLVKAVGGFGLSMFFLLSAYLITELLLREREQSGTIAWGLFFTRRALRIWPLYYGALAVGIVLALILPGHDWVSRSGITVMSLFVANWFRLTSQFGRGLGHLWSISVEEQFYLIWPPIVKFGGKTLLFVTSICFFVLGGVWLRVFSEKGWTLWYDTPVEFLFFAAGAIVAIATRGKSSYSMNSVIRGGLLIAGLLLLAVAAHFGRVGTDYELGITIAALYIGYSAAVAGCVVIFFAILGMSNVTPALIYLGKISYGLYVFHVGMLRLSIQLANQLKLPSESLVTTFLIDGAALLLSIFAAHLSYRYFERPFLKLKERFEVVKSRPS
jgi:peptidoglycan/LPS O-acetylase OafA/YrhL